MWKLRNLKETVEHKVMSYTPTQIKVREATNEEPWGPTSECLHELADISYGYETFKELMDMLWQRLTADSSAWKRLVKSLVVVDHLLKYGSERVASYVREHAFVLKRLTTHSFLDEDGNDKTKNIHRRVKEIIELVTHPGGLEAERRKAKELKSRLEKSFAISASTTTSYQPTRSAPTESPMVKAFRFVDQIRQKLSGEDEEVGHELRPYEYSDTPKTVPAAYLEPKPVPPVKDLLFDPFAEPTQAPKVEKEDDFGGFESKEPEPLVQTAGDSLMDLFTAPPGNSAPSQQAGFGAMDLFNPQASNATTVKFDSFEAFGGLFNQSPPQNISYRPSAQPDPFSTNQPDASKDLDTLLSQNLNDLFSQSPNSSFGAQHQFEDKSRLSTSKTRPGPLF